MRMDVFAPHGSFLLDFLAALLGIGLLIGFIVAFSFGVLVIVYLLRAWTLPVFKSAAAWLDDPLGEKKEARK